MTRDGYRAALAMNRERLDRWEHEKAALSAVTAVSMLDELAFARVAAKRAKAATALLIGLAGERVGSKCAATYGDGEFRVYSPDAVAVECVRRMAGRILDAAPKVWAITCVKVRLTS